MSDVVGMVGEYQLANLIRNGVGFLYLDLRGRSRQVTEGSGHELLKGLVAVPTDKDKAEVSEVVVFVESMNLSPQHPIVLLCETGTVSKMAVSRLEEAGFINSFYVLGGSEALFAKS